MRDEDILLGVLVIIFIWFCFKYTCKCEGFGIDNLSKITAATAAAAFPHRSSSRRSSRSSI